MTKTRITTQTFIQTVLSCACLQEAAEKLDRNEMSVYQRYNKLRKEYPQLPAKSMKPNRNDGIADFINDLLSEDTAEEVAETEVPEGWDRVEGGEETTETTESTES